MVVADALHTQHALITQVVEGGGNYVRTIKENQLNSYRAIELLFTTPDPVISKRLRNVIISGETAYNKNLYEKPRNSCYFRVGFKGINYGRHYSFPS